MPVILAHGALGPFDEIIFIGIAVIFVAMMALSWFRSQAMTEDEFEDEEPLVHEGEHFELQ